MSSKILKIKRDPFEISIDEGQSLIHAIAKADLKFHEITGGKFPIEGIKSMLQLVYDPKTGEFYDDVGIDVRDSNKKYLRVRLDPLMPIPNDSVAIITPDAGC
ncbi:MAG: hypothetical protein ACTSRP_11640 [Candidatus Helarchaeota archaeon]